MFASCYLFYYLRIIMLHKSKIQLSSCFVVACSVAAKMLMLFVDSINNTIIQGGFANIERAGCSIFKDSVIVNKCTSTNNSRT